MRRDAADVVDRLRGSREPRLLQLIDDALPAGTETRPDPDVVEPYRWFLERVGDGVKLTAAGYLPPAVVSETMRALGWDADWPGSGNREDLTVPVAELRGTARRLGLVRVHRGVLLQSVAGRRLAEDPAGLWRHIASRLPQGRRAPAPVPRRERPPWRRRRLPRRAGDRGDDHRLRRGPHRG